MGLAQSKHITELREAGWRSRGYLPHFDGREVPQFISLHLFDSLPVSVITKWKQELDVSDSNADRILLQRRIEKFLDQGYGQAFMKDHRIAAMIQDVLLGADGKSYRLSAWVSMPNHVHMLATRFAGFTLASIMQTFKSITSHKANRMLKRRGRFWMPDYFDRYIRNANHFRSTIRYIENNPVKARLCVRAEDWLSSSAGYRSKEEAEGVIPAPQCDSNRPRQRGLQPKIAGEGARAPLP
jgi:REP element-mobilizing transposase RayT